MAEFRPPDLCQPSSSNHVTCLHDPRTFSVLSHNILLPNSDDGWWTYKNYTPATPDAHKTWEHRQTLLESKVVSENPDIICYQESSERSHETDFPFLKDYASNIHKKGRMRCQTFWRTTAFELAEESLSKDHSLITPLRVIETGDVVFVVNVHLMAGGSGDRRLRQLHDAVETVRKRAAAMKVVDSGVKVVVAGDMNSESSLETATGTYLVAGKVEGGFTEGDKIITSKTKNCAFKFADAYGEAYTGATRPPTLIAPALIDRMIGSRHGDRGIIPTQALLEASRAVFNSYADTNDESGSVPRMSRLAVERFLCDINGSCERGDEMRNANALLAAKEDSDDALFAPADMLSLYVKELEGGKYWGVASDFVRIATKFDWVERLKSLRVLPDFYVEGRDPLESEVGDATLFQAVFDYIFYSSDTLRCDGVLDISEEKRRPIPDSSEPSDHFCLKACFKMKEHLPTKKSY
jgi:endonuclease/exonuclease/phosphatase family metal-dependent hydrolase